MEKQFEDWLKDTIFKINFKNFNDIALELFHYQANNNLVYKQFLNLIQVDPNTITQITDIPFLPIEFFKTHKVITGRFTPEKVFESSGTTSQNTAKHYLKSFELYKQSFLKGFEYFFGSINNKSFLALLPSYLENPNASLVYMAKSLIEKSGHSSSGFFLDDYEELQSTIEHLKAREVPFVLLGVSFALLEFAEHYGIQLPNDAVVMETGGMKGKRREMIRVELHERLKKGFGKNAIQSEYGMTELLSQAYAYREGYFATPPWMKVLIRNPYDPFEVTATGKGALNIIDLANIHSCAFIATNDLGKAYENGLFEVLGRFDHSDIRGCNLLVT